MQNEFVNHEHISITKLKLRRLDSHKFNAQDTVKGSIQSSAGLYNINLEILCKFRVEKELCEVK